MREEIRQELQRKIAAKFDQALGEKPKVKVVSRGTKAGEDGAVYRPLD